MYLDHFNLKTKPFALSTDPRFLWAGANQRQALATLSYGLQENRGLVVLSGEFGTGKTTLVNAFVQSLDDTVRVAHLSEPGTDLAQFILAVAEGFGIQIESTDLEGLTEGLIHLAEDQQGYQQRLLLIIDEVQGLTAEMQGDVLHLARLEAQGQRLLHILLVGHCEIYQWAASAAREAFLDQVSATCRLYPLNASETEAYIDFRLRVAGAGRTIFGERAVSAIHAFSRGVPRVINLMCDFALLHAHLKDAEVVDAEMVGICKDRFQIATLDDGDTSEVTVRDLTTLPTERGRPDRRKFWRGLGLAVSVVLFLILVGYWYYEASIPTSLTQEKVDLKHSPPLESFPPFRTPPYPAPLRQTNHAAASQKAAALSFSGQQSEARQIGPLKVHRSPTETVADPQPAASQAGDSDGVQRTSGNQLPKAQPNMKTSFTAEPSTTPPTLRRANADTASQAPEASIEVDPETPTDADPGDIIDWLIREKQKDGSSAQKTTNAIPLSEE
jgi:general secretion pathway protein A